MAFQSLVEDSRKMNAKMIAMGQSINIQRSPRPKPGTISAQKMTYTPAGSDLEKMLYPKNFKPRAYELETEKKANEDAEIIQAITEQEEIKETPKIIGDDAIVMEPVKEEPQEEEKEEFVRPVMGPAWTRCKSYKAQGDRAFCKEYLGWCAKDKCARPKF